MKIEARVVKDSISENGVRLVTIEGTMHRFVLAEMNKHRMLSQSAQSSRAVPVEKMLKLVREHPAMPVHWGANQRGMRADEQCEQTVLLGANDTVTDNYGPYVFREEAWRNAAAEAAQSAENFSNAGYHKQIVNRLLEPFLWQKIVITGTEWDNFFNLRLHVDAQPEIRQFAMAIKDAMNKSTPQILRDSSKQWHLPYVEVEKWSPAGGFAAVTDSGEFLPDIETAKKYSAARCATTSYRTEGVSVAKALQIYELLVESSPWHAVPLEHVARPLKFAKGGWAGYFEDPLQTHVDKNQFAWSGNFRGWGQMRKEIEGSYL